MAIGREILDRLPQLALAILAAKRGGPLAAAAFNQGVQQRDAYRSEMARQAQIDDERRQAAAQAQQDRQRQLTLQEQQASRLAAGDQRAAEQEDYARKIGAVNFLSTYAKDLGETATDPVAAEQAFSRQAVMREGLAGMEPGSLVAMTPSFTAPISARKASSIRRVASAKLKEIRDTFGDQADSGTYEVEELADLLKGEYPGALSLADLQRYAGIQATGLTGAPLTASQKPATTGASDLDRTYRRLRAAFVDQNQREPNASEDVALDKQAREEAKVVTPVDPSIAELRRLNIELARQRVGPDGNLNPRQQSQVTIKQRGFDSQPVTRRVQTMAEAVTFSQSLNPNTNNAADDQGLIYAFAKAMDPESVVREGEYATVQKYAQAWADSMGFNAARVFSNTPFLTPQARQNMKSTIQSRFAATKQQYDNLRREYATQIDKITGGADGETYLVDYAQGFNQAAPAGSSAPRIYYDASGNPVSR